MKLTTEDLFKMNVLMAQKPRAIRIKENTMQVFGLTDKGDACVNLSTAARQIPYLRAVREFLADRMINSPGGFPIHITSWTRMGQTNVDNLESLLMLGEPDAVSAVVYAKALTPEIGHNAWWCVPESENARRMLEKEKIVNSELGPVLANHLYEHLDFETDPKLMVESVKLMLQPGLLSEEERDKLWKRSQRKGANMVGFLQSAPEAILHGCVDHQDYQQLSNDLSGITDSNENHYVQLARWFLSREGQGFMQTAYKVLQKVSNQDVVLYLLETLRTKMQTFVPVAADTISTDLDEILKLSEALIDESSRQYFHTDEQWKSMIMQLKNNHRSLDQIRSMLFLSQLTSPVVTPVFSRTTAEATLMRRKLKYLMDPIFAHFESLFSANI